MKVVTTKKNNKLRDLKEEAYEVHNSKTIKGIILLGTPYANHPKCKISKI